jgi:hypothetical protein
MCLTTGEGWRPGALTSQPVAVLIVHCEAGEIGSAAGAGLADIRDRDPLQVAFCGCGLEGEASRPTAAGGRPGLRRRPLRPPSSSARCRRRGVGGLTAKQDERSGGSSRLSRSQQRSIDGRVPRPLPPAPEERQLVAQDHDLKLPFTAAAREHANDAAQEPIQQTHQHDGQSEPLTSTAAPAESNFFPRGGPRIQPRRVSRVRAPRTLADWVT